MKSAVSDQSPLSQNLIVMAHTSSPFEELHSLDLQSSANIVVDGEIALLTEFPDGEIEVNVTNDGVAICICESGEMTLHINGEMQSLTDGELLVCFPYVQVTTFERSSDFRGCVLYFSDVMLTEVLHSERMSFDNIFFIKSNPKVHIGTQGCEFYRGLQQLLQSFTVSAPTRRFAKIQRSLLLAFFYHLLDIIESSLPNFDKAPLLLNRKQILFKRFFELLSSEYPKHRDVMYYAEKLCLSPKYLTAVCREVAGRSATELIHQAVVEDARRLLLHSELSIKEIAVRLNFPNLSFFGKYIKAHLGTSPTDFRKQYLDKE